MSKKIIYLGSTASTDSDFPLLRELQNLGADVTAYFPMSDWNKRKGLIAADDIEHVDAIIPAAQVPAFNIYGDYLNLSNVFVVNGYHYKRYDPRSWWLWLKVLKHMRGQNPAILHTVWPLAKTLKILYSLKCRRVVTVHDPIPHSGLANRYDEQCRRKAFDTADRLVLLSDSLRDEFVEQYSIDAEKIMITKMGEFNYLQDIKGAQPAIKEPYILFFGQIQSHKGVDDLLEAMTMVHEKFPHIKLVIAGKGKFHFDISPFEKLDYIEFRNYYITVPELAGLLQNCLFAVCPYKDATQSGVVQTAFSANVPLVVTNVGALPVSVTDNVTGLVVPPSNPAALASAMERLLANPDLLARFRKNINDVWRPSMNWKPIAEDYIKCYNELMK